MNEFELVQRFFSGRPPHRDDVRLGIGDDAAVLRVPAGMELAATVDSLIEDVHFPANLSAEAIGHRALAVNLSDLAAMGAEPAWALLALTLSQAEEPWLAGFARGFFNLAERHRVALVGGNLARGALNVTVTLHGWVPAGKALTRRKAGVGDQLFITGWPGEAVAGLYQLQADTRLQDGGECVKHFCFPEPRVEAGLALRDLASACVDVSDGLLVDLGHVLDASGVGATIELEHLPLSAALLKRHARSHALELALTGGDDYELCFTLPPAHAAMLHERFKRFNCPVTRIGAIDSDPGIRCVDGEGQRQVYPVSGYRHF